MPGENVVNNYYGDEGHRGADRDLAGNDDGGFYNTAHDASREDSGAGSHGFADTDSDADLNSTANDNAGNDDMSDLDDSSDFSSSDDAGGFDGGDSSDY